MDFLAYAANGSTTATSILANPIWMILIMLAIFYFLLIRPQQKERNKHAEMLATLKKGDKVITSGGLHGEISGIKDDVITMEIAPKVRVQISRRFIAGLLK
jgi:preprotein translocase subunit YajC